MSTIVLLYKNDIKLIFRNISERHFAGEHMNRYFFSLCVLCFSTVSCSSSNTHSANQRSSTSSHQITDIAQSYLGYPYRYGGHTPSAGFDCSGLVYHVHQQAGVKLPRTARAQYKSSKPVSKKHLRPGDLLFFKISRDKITHVGIYLGNNKFIHAPSSGKRVSIASLENPYWKRRFVRGGRI